MPFNLSSTSTITLTNANDPLTSLLVQAEILNRGAFFGFEVYASAEGVIRVSVKFFKSILLGFINYI